MRKAIRNGTSTTNENLRRVLVNHITRFLLEFGAGFAFIGSQYRLEVASEKFFIDLLFYHVRLHCYVVIELKTVKFKPEYAGRDKILITQH